eukprot:UN20017
MRNFLKFMIQNQNFYQFLHLFLLISSRNSVLIPYCRVDIFISNKWMSGQTNNTKEHNR